jgi:hypothetical protein
VRGKRKTGHFVQTVSTQRQNKTGSGDRGQAFGSTETSRNRAQAKSECMRPKIATKYCSYPDGGVGRLLPNHPIGQRVPVFRAVQHAPVHERQATSCWQRSTFESQRRCPQRTTQQRFGGSRRREETAGVVTKQIWMRYRKSMLMVPFGSSAFSCKKGQEMRTGC